MEYLQNRLNSLLESGRTTQAQMAREIGVSPSAISQYRKGTYAANDASNLEKKLEDYLQKLEDRDAAAVEMRTIGFVENKNSRAIFEIAHFCRIKQKIAVVTGDAGLGKTTAVREYAARHSDVVLVYGHKSMTIKGLFQKVCQALGLDSRGRTETLFERCAHRLGEMKGLLIIDEAEHLSLATLDEVRRINDKEFGGSGVLLVGLPRFFDMVRSRRFDYEYLCGRIAQHIPVGELPPEDVQAFVKAAIPGADDSLGGLFGKYETNPRHLVRLIENTVSLACKHRRPIDEELIFNATRYQI